MELNLFGGAEQQEAFEKIKKYLSSTPVLKASKRGIPFRLCRIVIPASPPGVYPVVEFQDGDLRTKSLMVR